MWIKKRKNNIQKNYYYERKILLNYLNDHTEVLANVGTSCHIFNLVIQKFENYRKCFKFRNYRTNF